MIGKLKGIPEPVSPRNLIMMVNGVGYSIYTSNRTLSKLKKNTPVTLFTYTIVSKETIELFGFLSNEEKRLFQLLITVPGIGPKTAIAILDFGVAPITNAIVKADVSFFSQIPKIGKKSAQKIIIELKSKLGSLEELDLSKDTGETKDLIDTLASLGFERKQIFTVIKQIPSDIKTIEEKVRFALRKLGSS